MTATEGNLLQFLGPMAHFSIPVYQRTYTWSRAQCDQLWRDVVAAAERGPQYQHFIGAVVYIEQRETVWASAPSFLVIDGQQRLTTVSLLLAALCERLPENLSLETRSQYLINGLTQDPERRRKLILTQRDRDTLFRAAAGEPLPDDASPVIANNLEYFRNKLAESGVNPEAVLLGLQRMQFVNVKLRQDVDDPQLIFESLNATGIKLSQSDLVRNTLLMSLPAYEQQSVYEQAWHPLEKLMISEADPDRFDNMLRDYLGSEQGNLVNQRDLHAEVRRRLRGGVSRADFARDLHRFGKAWHEVAIGTENSEGVLRAALDRVRAVNAGVANPFLARLLKRVREAGGDLSEVVEAALWTEAYVMRRLLAQVATNTMNRTFIVMARDCPATRVGEWLANRTSRLGYSQRFPTDEDVLTVLETRDVYRMKNRGYLLECLENYGNKDLIRANNYTLEHVMPQNPGLNPVWQDELGDDWKGVQERRLHTLGNLTLTGYNPELSDRSFTEKKTMKGGFDESPVRLSRALREAKVWNEVAIIARTRELGRTVCAIWPRPVQVAEQVGEKPEVSRRLEFWSELLAATEEITPLFSGRNPTDYHHIGVPSGTKGFVYQFWVHDNHSRINLQIDSGTAEDNLSLFRKLLAQKEAIEADFGAPLLWRELPDSRSCGIEWRLGVGSEDDAEEAQAAIPTLARRMATMEEVFAPRLAAFSHTAP